MARRSTNALSLAIGVMTTAAAVLVHTPAQVGAAPTRQAAPAAAPTLPDRYAQRVDRALSNGTDHWGEKLLGLPDGPTFDNVKPLLVPANHAGTDTAASPWYYLPFTYPAPDPSRYAEERDFSLHVADGSELLSQWATSLATQHATFFVGTGTERYGSAEERSAEPRLTGGYLPILANSYRDAGGATVDRESFVTELTPGGAAVSMVRFTTSAATTLRLQLQRTGIERAVASGGRVTLDGRTVVAHSGSASWAQPNLTVQLAAGQQLYLVLPNEPADLGAVVPSAQLYDGAKSRTTAYWEQLLNAGATVHVPEQYAADAMRNTLLNNLMMGFNLTVGNGYESLDKNFAFVPEVAATVTSLGDFGHRDRFRANTVELLRRGQGLFVAWERGIKLQTVATYYLQTNDRTLLEQNLPTFRAWLDDFARQRAADPNDLLAKARYASDIPTPIYGLHHQSEVWRGLRDLGVALKLMGRAADAAPFIEQASGLSGALHLAVQRSKTTLPDDSIFVPISLLDETSRTPYDKLTENYLGSYWNLIMPYVLATGLFVPGSGLANGMRAYLDKHGSQFLGLTRFNLFTSDVGVCQTLADARWPGTQIPGYRSTGIDQQYGYSLMRFLADNGAADRLDLSLYGMLAHNFTPHTFVGGEGATVSPCPQFGEYYRSQYWPPLSPNNATYLEALRSTLVSEDLDDNGQPSRLHLAPATPRSWFGPGQRIEVAGLPTSFGPAAYRITSDLANGSVTAQVTPPPAETGRAPLTDLILHLRAPDGHELTGVTVDGQPVAFDAERELVRLGVPAAAVTVRADYRQIARATTSSAEVAPLDSRQTLFQPGEPTPLRLELETLGTGTVDGTVEIQAPAGWQVGPSSVPFSTTSSGKVAWAPVVSSVTVPTGTPPGTHQLTVTARPTGGPAKTLTLPVRVVAAEPLSYPSVVRRDGPAGYWRLGEVAGVPAADSSGGGAHGSYRGQLSHQEPGAIADSDDGSVRLVDGYVEIPDRPALSPTGPYTVEAWVRSNAGGTQSVIEKYDAPAKGGFALRLHAANKLEMLNLADTLYPSGRSKASLRQDRWQHLVQVYDGQRLMLYLDGVLAHSAPVAKAPTDGLASLKIGARGDDGKVRFFGWVDEVAVYNHVLTADQIHAHYAKGVVGSAPAGPGPC